MLEQFVNILMAWKGKSTNCRRVKANQPRMTKKLIRAKYQLCCHEGLSQIEIQIYFAYLFLDENF